MNDEKDHGLNQAQPMPWRKWIAALVVLAATVHVLVTIRETRHSADWKKDGLSSIRWPDERNAYVPLADGVANGGTKYLKDEIILRSPPLPWAWLLLWGRSIVATRFVNIALVLFGSYLVASIARRRWGDRMGLLAFLLCACGYQVVLFTGTVLTEPLALFFCCLFLWAMDRLVRTDRAWYAALAGVATGLGSLSRTSLQMLPLAVVVLGVLLWHWRRRAQLSPLGFSTWKLGWLLLCHVAIISPVLLWNYRTFGVARIANGLGAVLYLGSDLRTEGDEPPFFGMQYQTGQITQSFDHLQIEGDARLTRAAKENIRQNLPQWLMLCIPKAGRILVGGSGYHFMPGDCYPAKARLVGNKETAMVFAWWTVAGTIVALFGAAGLIWMLRTQAGVALAASSLVGYLVLLHSVTFSLPRFGLPFYPALVLGVCGYLKARPPRWLTVVVVVAVVAACGYLALYHDYYPRCMASERRFAAFTVDQTWKPTVVDGVATIETSGIEPGFNACLFIRATASARGHRPVYLNVLVRTDDGKEFNEAAHVGLPLTADGQEHLYQFCVELLPAWKGHRWQALRFETQPRDGVELKIREVALAH